MKRIGGFNMAIITAGITKSLIGRLAMTSNNLINNFSITSIVLDRVQITEFVSSKLVPLLDFGLNYLVALSISVYKKPLKVIGSNIFTFDGYNGYYSLDGITRVDESKAKYRYVFYVFFGFNNVMGLNFAFSSYNTKDEDNRFKFAEICHLTMSNGFDIEYPGLTLTGRVGVGPVQSLTDTVIWYEDLIMPFIPSSYMPKFFGGSVETIELEGSKYDYLVDIDTVNSNFDCIRKCMDFPEYNISFDLMRKFGRNMLPYNPVKSFSNDRWSVQYALPWFTSVPSDDNTLRVEFGLPSLLYYNDVNVLSLPCVPFVNFDNINIGTTSQTFSIVFPGVELIRGE